MQAKAEVALPDLGAPIKTFLRVNKKAVWTTVCVKCLIYVPVVCQYPPPQCDCSISYFPPLLGPSISVNHMRSNVKDFPGLKVGRRVDFLVGVSP